MRKTYPYLLQWTEVEWKTDTQGYPFILNF